MTTSAIAVVVTIKDNKHRQKQLNESTENIKQNTQEKKQEK